MNDEVEANLTQVGSRSGTNLWRCQKPAAGFGRSGARASMPGMMDTILNLGLNDTHPSVIIAQDPVTKLCL